MSVYRGKTKTEKNGQNYWNDTGHTIFVEEKNGQMQIGMVDARNPGVKVYFFPAERKAGAAPSAPAPSPRSDVVDGDFGDLPF